MKKITKKDIEGFLKVCKSEKGILDKAELQKKFDDCFEKKAVLGFDIYRYSKYPQTEQALIPYIFKILYDTTIKNCLSHEKFLFQKYKTGDFDNNFIDTGDGGFQIFDSPLESVIFALYFQANIQRFNSGFLNHLVELRDLVGEITLRYSLTYDFVYSFNDNFYGTSIISNARIMSKDKLNRFLIDENTYFWFRKSTNGIESLFVLKTNDFKKIESVKDFNFDTIESYLFEEKPSGARILKVDLLKIGEVISKLDKVSIYSLCIQSFMKSSGRELEKIVVTIGNLNASGIIEE